MAVLKKGSKGTKVRKLQASLNKQGAKPPLAEDGIFGLKTLDAVKTFQKKVKLKPDGLVGELTLAALLARGKIPEIKVEDNKNKAALHKKYRAYNGDFNVRMIRLVGPHDPSASNYGFFDQEEAYRFLRGLAWEHSNHEHFRNVWLQLLGSPGSRPPGKDKMFRDLAFQLFSGRLRVARSIRTARSTGTSGTLGMTSRSGTETAAPPQEARRDTRKVETITSSMLRPARPEPSVEPDPTVAPEPVIDVAQQIAVLTQAAEDGTPFAEQCE